MPEFIYEIKGLCHSYNDSPVLEIEDLSIFRDSIVGLTGPNGSGKSTLLKLLGFIENPQKGEILFKRQKYQIFSSELRHKVTLLPQETYLMKRSVFKNIAYGLKLRGDMKDIGARVHESLEMVGLGGNDFAERRWYELSGGEAQRVALAARLILKPEVLLLDEPTSGVDAASARMIKNASLRARDEWGTTLVISSHDWQWLYEVCDDVVHLFKGQFFCKGNENIFYGPWYDRKDGYWESILKDGQKIIVREPGNKNFAAGIDSSGMDLYLPEDDMISNGGYSGHYPLNTLKRYRNGNPEKIFLKGIVSRLILEKKSGNIVTTILVENLHITKTITHDQARSLNIFPGQKILIAYDPDCVKWL